MTKSERIIKAQRALENKVAVAITQKTGIAITGDDFAMWLDDGPDNATINQIIKKLFSKKVQKELIEAQIDIWEALCIKVGVHDGFSPDEVTMITGALT